MKSWKRGTAIVLCILCCLLFSSAFSANYATYGDASDTTVFYVTSNGNASLEFNQSEGLCYVLSYSFSPDGEFFEEEAWGKYHLLITAPDGRQYSEDWNRTSDGESYTLKLNYSGLYTVQVVPFTEDEMSSSWNRGEFYYWMNVPQWWINAKKNCSAAKSIEATVRVRQIDIDTRAVLEERSVTVRPGNNTVSAGNTPSGYTAVYGTSSNVYVSDQGIPEVSVVDFYYRKNARQESYVNIYCYDLYGNLIDNYRESVPQSKSVSPKSISGYRALSGAQYVWLSGAACSPANIVFYYEGGYAPVPTQLPTLIPTYTPRPTLLPIITPVPTPVPTLIPTNTPRPTMQPDPGRGNPVTPFSWDTQFKPGTSSAGKYNDKRVERLPNIADDNYRTSFDWLVWSSEMTDDIPELTAFFSGETISSIGIRNGCVRSYSDYSQFARPKGITVVVHTLDGRKYETYMALPDKHTTEYQIYNLNCTVTNVDYVDFWLNSYFSNSKADLEHQNVIHIADIQFYR